MRKFLLNIIKYSLIALLLVNAISFLSLYLLSKSEFYKPSYLVNHFNKQTKFDYIVLGSSRGLTTINTNQIDEALGTKGVNLSIDDTGLPTHSLMLTHFFENDFKTKKVILTLDSAFFKNKKMGVSDNDYRFLPFVTNDYVRSYFTEYENGMFKKYSLSGFFPFIGVSYYNLELFFPSLVTIFSPQRHNRFDDNGNYRYPDKKLNSIKKLGIENTNISNLKLLELKRMCTSNDAELIIYVAPIYNTQLNINKSLGIEVINHTSLLKSTDNFYDVIHVNKKGREIATDALMKYIN
ncbi:MAG: hypothetical protein COA88_05805 [Kordia sp.]|nr:MAG: hypothetical protein COA88_05805 [Kordia sp.]